MAALPDCATESSPVDDVEEAEVSLLIDGRLYLATSDGAVVRCLEVEDGVFEVAWGPRADRVFTGSTVAHDGTEAPFAASGSPEWSRPTGTSLVWIEDGHLRKRGVDQATSRDLSFLSRHDAVAYHPAGVEIATIGEHEDGRYGVWLSDNEGGKPRLLIESTGAVLGEFQFSEMGVSGFFIADHGDEQHVHEAFLVLPEDAEGFNELDASIRYTSQRGLSSLVVGPEELLIAAQEGECGGTTPATVALGDNRRLPSELRDVDATPIGWLPGARLVVGTFPRGCDGAMDVWVASFGLVSGFPAGADLLVSGVDAAHVRRTMPDPPDPLGDVSLDQFA